MWPRRLVTTTPGTRARVTGPGSQRLPLAFADGAYRACTIKLTDSFGGSMALDITPAVQGPVDAYTGATVQVWGLPIGPTFSGNPPTTSDLSAGDMQTCQRGSSLVDLCANAINTSVTPASQTPQLFGCYPSGAQCGSAAHAVRHAL